MEIGKENDTLIRREEQRQEFKASLETMQLKDNGVTSFKYWKEKKLLTQISISCPPPKKKTVKNEREIVTISLKQTIIVGIYCQLLYLTGNVKSSSGWRQITSEENLDLYKRMKCTRNEINQGKIKLFILFLF